VQPGLHPSKAVLRIPGGGKKKNRPTGLTIVLVAGKGVYGVEMFRVSCESGGVNETHEKNKKSPGSIRAQHVSKLIGEKAVKHNKSAYTEKYRISMLGYKTA